MDSGHYDLQTCTCSIRASTPVHAILRHYLSAYETPDLHRCDIDLTINTEETAVTEARKTLTRLSPSQVRTSHPNQRYHIWTTDGQQILTPERANDHVITVQGNHISLVAHQHQIAATVGVRIVRQLIMRAGETRHGQSVHAGAAILDTDGVLIAGHAGAGKTSVLTRLIEDHGARPVANDRTVLTPGDNVTWSAVGVPLAWRFTPQGIDGSTALTHALTIRDLSRGRDLVDGKIELTPLEISQALAVPAAAAAPITRLIILTRTANKQPPAPDHRFIRDHLDFGADDFFTDDWLGVRPLFPSLTAQPPLDADAWWARLATTVPVQVISWTDPTELGRVAATIAQGQP
ncbi:hypothetical protein SAMN05216266_1476 [Amycolatopsis marina]|uniref:Hpr(Ser) kinase/phosphatase n=2 Tax=Amycolatopsis marina TaxID=490629 RepID=A0A1I1CWG0_9PSEU|nr:hypothetical protein SAMN05216266_1476 [Amycolatopsis marina]